MLPASAIALADLDDELPTKTSEARLRADTETATDLMAVRPPMASEPPTIERIAPGLPCLAEIRALAETADPDVTGDDPTLAPAQPAVDHEDPTLAPPRPSATLAIFPATARTVIFPEPLDAGPPAKSAQVLPMPPPRPPSAPRPLAIVPSPQSTPRAASAPPPTSSPPPPMTSAASPPMSAPRGMRVRSLVVLVLVLAFFSGMGSTFGFEVLSHAAPLPLRSPRAIEGDATKLSLAGGATAHREVSPEPAPPPRRRRPRRRPSQPQAPETASSDAPAERPADNVTNEAAPHWGVEAGGSVAPRPAS